MITKREAIAAAAATALLVAPGCSQKPRSTTAAQVEPIEAESGAPAMFDAVPADSPYVFASLDPLPSDVWEMYGEMLSSIGAFFDVIAAEVAADDATSVEARFALALAAELTENAGKEGLTSIGIDPDPRVVFYGLGAMPVLRVEVSDGAVLRETIERVEAESGYELPTRDIAGVPVWWLGEDEAAGVAIVGDELVASFGPEPALVAAFEVVSGERDVGATLSESELRELADAQQASALGFGFLDTRRLAGLLLGHDAGVQGAITADFLGGVPEVSDACASSVDAALAHVPRIALSYPEMSRERIAMEGVVETSDDLAELLASVQTRVPGLSGSFDEPPLFAIGAAADLAAGARLLERVAAELRVVGDACDDPELQQVAAELGAGAAGGIPAPLAAVRGGLFVLQSIDMAQMSADGYALAGIDGPATLLRLAGSFVPQLAELDVATDGVFRPVPSSLTDMLPLDLGLSYAVGDSAVAVAAGDGGRSAAEAAMVDVPESSPLFMMAYDYSTLFGLVLDAMPAGGGPADEASRAVMETLASFFGPMSMRAMPAENGLVLESVLELGAGAASE